MVGDKRDKQPWQYISVITVVKILAQVGCLTLVIALSAVFGGLWLDDRLGTRPWLTIALVVLTGPIITWAIYKVTTAGTAHLRSSTVNNNNVEEKNP